MFPLTWGWFSVERNIIDKAIFQDKSLLQLYVYLRSQAKWKPVERLIDGKKVIIQPGELTTGSRELAGILGVSPSTAYRLLKKLEKLGDITIKKHHSCSQIRLAYWPTEVPKSETPTNPDISRGAVKKLPFCETQMKHEWNANETQMKTPIERYKYKKNNYTCEFESFWFEYPRKKEKAKAFKVWNARLREGHTADEMITAAKNYATECVGRDEKYIKHGSTFIGPDKPFLEYIEKRAVKKKTFDSSKYQYPSQDPRNFRVL